MAQRFYVGFVTLLVIIIVSSYYFLVTVPKNESQLNQRGFRILSRIEENIYTKKNGVIKTIDDVQSWRFKYEDEGRLRRILSAPTKENLGTAFKIDTAYHLPEIEGLTFKYFRTQKQWHQRYDTSEFYPFYDDYEDRWTIKFFGDVGTPDCETCKQFVAVYSYDAATFLQDIVNYRNDLFEQYIISYNDSIIYQTGSLVHRANAKELFKQSSVLSDVSEVDTISGKVYRSFIHVFNESHSIPFVIRGLVPAEKYSSEKYIPNSEAVTWLSIIFVSIFLLFPVIKLAFMSKLERLSLFDVYATGIGIAVVTGVVVLSILFFAYDKSIDSLRQGQLRTLACKIDSSLHNEVNSVLTEARTHLKNVEDGNYELWLKNNLDVLQTSNQGEVKKYSNKQQSNAYLKTMFLIDNEDISWAAFASDETVRPALNLNHRYYARAFNHQNSKVKPFKDAIGEFYLQPIYSSVDQQNSIVATVAFDGSAFERINARIKSKWKKVGKGVKDMKEDIYKNRNPWKVKLLALESILFSVSNPILDTGKAFFIVDKNGDVQFHSDQKRNLRENIFDESNHDARVVEILRMGMEEYIEKMNYYGHTYSAYFKPVTGLPFTLVVVTDKSMDKDSSANILSTTLFHWLILLAISILIVGILTKLSSRKFSTQGIDWLRMNHLTQAVSMSGIRVAIVFALLITVILVAPITDLAKAWVYMVAPCVFMTSIKIYTPWVWQKRKDEKKPVISKTKLNYQAVLFTLVVFILSVLPTIGLFKISVNQERKLIHRRDLYNAMEHWQFRQDKIADQTKLIDQKDTLNEFMRTHWKVLSLSGYFSESSITQIPLLMKVSDKKNLPILEADSLFKYYLKLNSLIKVLAPDEYQSEGMYLYNTHGKSWEMTSESSIQFGRNEIKLKKDDDQVYNFAIVVLLILLFIPIVLYISINKIHEVLVLKKYFFNGDETQAEGFKQRLTTLVGSCQDNVMVIAMPGTDALGSTLQIITDSHFELKEKAINVNIPLYVFGKTKDNEKNDSPRRSIIVIDMIDRLELKFTPRLLMRLRKFGLNETMFLVLTSTSGPRVKGLDQDSSKWYDRVPPFVQLYYELEDYSDNAAHAETEFRFGNFVNRLKRLINNDKKTQPDEVHLHDVLTMLSGYYKLIWCRLSDEEKYTLYDMATDGIINHRDYPILVKLKNRGIIVFDKLDNGLKIFNESFRTFILNLLNDRDAENLQEKMNVHGTWEAIRLVLIISILCFAVFIFVTDQPVFKQAITFITSIGAALPLVSNFARSSFKWPSFTRK